MGMVFEDREEAGRRLAEALPQFREQPDTVLLGLARGGIPVAVAAAKVLHLPYGAVLVRKLGIPGHGETAFGALAYTAAVAAGGAAERAAEDAGGAASAEAGGPAPAGPGPETGGPEPGRIVRLLNRPLVERILENGVRQEWMDQVESRERDELLRRAETYPGGHLELHGKTVLLVDDGLATGATMRAAVEAVRSAGASRVVAAAPVGSIEAERSLSRVCDVLCLHLPGKFRAVGSFYRHFDQLTDDDAIGLLHGANA
ncbi:phosphoribosyltransferase [Arthrobacter sp. ISL-28]|uniref:phosphoribosyltransferase n=1 Tax=Arthrobacter sp. ISL-28 TaxID=2819108 RepID=UPI0020352CE3|nr:phosphoribosyltransferase family protein [Arthrobacter sp. ISL-28]